MTAEEDARDDSDADIPVMHERFTCRGALRDAFNGR